MKFINLTPHDVVLGSGIVIPKSGDVMRVTTEYGSFDANGIAPATYKAGMELPSKKPGVCYIVSGLAAVVLNRRDVVSPAVLHPDCMRAEDGSIASVPGFFRMTV